MAQSSKLLNYTESFNVAGVNKTKLYTELNCNFNVNDKIFIIGGNYDNANLAISDPFSPYALGYKILNVNIEENSIVIDLNYTGTSVESLLTPGEVFISRNYFKKGQFNGGSFNDGVFGDGILTNTYFNNKKTSFSGSHIINAHSNHMIWKSGTWRGGEWKSKTDSYQGNFKTYKAQLNNAEDGVVVNELNNSERNNFLFGYNRFISGVWEDGEWDNGTWEDGLWMNGVFNYGYFKKGTWMNGTKHAGKFSSINGLVTWNDGIHNNGEMIDVKFENGTWNNGTWKGNNNVSVKYLRMSTVFGYITSDYLTIELSDLSMIDRFSVGDEISILYIKDTVNDTYTHFKSVIEQIVSNEIIVRHNMSVVDRDLLFDMNLDIAKVSNSYFKKGTWINGIWANGYRRPGYEIDFSSMNDTLGGELSFDIIKPVHWTGAISPPDIKIEIGDTVVLTNLTDNLGNITENLVLTVSNISLGDPTNVTVTGVLPSFTGNTVKSDINNNVFIDQILLEEITFNSGVWDGGYLKQGIFNAKLNLFEDTYLTNWLDGQWSYNRYDKIDSNNHSTWNNGVWNNGTIKNGVWNNGVFNSGTIDNSYEFDPTGNDVHYSFIWNNGVFNSGTFKGLWNNGTFNSGTWQAGLETYTETGVLFNFPFTEEVRTNDKLKFQLDGIDPLNGPVLVGDFITINSTLTSPGAVPTTLLDSNSDTVTGTSYKVIKIDKDVTNDKLYITVDSNQNYSGITDNAYTGDFVILRSVNVFNSGSFLGGTWNNGIFNSGLFDGATVWNNGDFNSGEFLNSHWIDGYFNDGKFGNSLWYNGIFNDGAFDGHTFALGTFNGGVIKNTNFLNGTFNNGLIKDSIVSNGTFNAGLSNNVTLNGGLVTNNFNFKDSIMNGGTLDGNAVFDDSIKYGGTILSGRIKGNSIHNGGDLNGGEWITGTWNNGTWDTPKHDSTDFNYEVIAGQTFIRLYSASNINLLSNTEFPDFTGWTEDPEWTIVSNTAECRIDGIDPDGTYTSELVQSSVSGLINSLSYKITFDIVTNSHPYTGTATAPVNRLFVEFDQGTAGSLEIENTNIGTKEVYYTPTGGGTPLDFSFKAEIMKAGVVDQFLSIDNISVEALSGNIVDISVNDHVWINGLGFKSLPLDTLKKLESKMIVTSIDDDVLEVMLDQEYIIERYNLDQTNLYTSKAIWRNGTIVEGSITGMIFKQGNLNYPVLSESVIENGDVEYTVLEEITNSGIRFEDVFGWSGTPGWSIIPGNAICSPTDSTIEYDLKQTGILTLSEYYVVTLTINNNTNYLEDYISVLAGDNEYYLGAAKPDVYNVIVKCEGNTDFKIRVRTKNISSASSNIILSNLNIQRIKLLEMNTSSAWLDGTANGILMDDSQWVNGTLITGILKDSDWINGECNQGTFDNVNWLDGTMNNGSVVNTSVMESGTFNQSLFLNGTFNCGVVNNSVLDGVFFYDGKIEGKSKFYDNAIVYGNLTYRRNPRTAFNLSNLNLDSAGNSIKIALNGYTLVTLICSDDYTSFAYPSGTYNSADWGSNQPSWVVNFRAAANWALDDPKIILRDLLDYYLNGEDLYLDIYDVDFIDSPDITDDLSGDGMVTSAYNQTSNYIRITEKSYNENVISKSGTSGGMTQLGTITGQDKLHWLSGGYIGDPGVNKITPNPTYRGADNSAGFIMLKFSEDLTGDISIGDYIHLQGTGKFNNDVSNIMLRDNTYKVTNIIWTGSLLEITTNVPATGVAPGFAPSFEVELWQDAIKTDVENDLDINILNKKGRYMNIVFDGNHTADFNIGDELRITDITEAVLLPYLDNEKSYTIRSVDLLAGPTTGVCIDVKSNASISIVTTDTVKATVIQKPSGINDFCLGGGGPGGGVGGGGALPEI